jgi:hypothetical protein
VHDTRASVSQTTADPSRRTILAGLPAAAASVTALASPALAGSPHPDAALLALEPDLNALKAQCKITRREQRVAMRRKACSASEEAKDPLYCSATVFCLPTSSPSANSRRMASGRVGFGSGCAAIQASRASSCSSRTRTRMPVPHPVGTGPRFFFDIGD